MSVPVTVDFLVPTLDAVSPVVGPCAAGTAVTLQGADLGSGTAVTVDGQPAPVSSGGTGSSLTVALPDIPAGTASVTVQIGSGPLDSTNSATYTCEVPPTVTGVSPAQGPITGGTVVEITGTGFVPGVGPSGPFPLTRVSFGGTALGGPLDPYAVQVVSTTELLVQSPPASATGPVDVTVTTPMGTTPSSAADRFTYEPDLPPASCAPSLSATDDLCVTGTGGTIDATLASGLSASLTGFSLALLGHLDPSTGAVTVPAAGAAFGQLSGSALGFPVGLTLTADGAASGNWDAATGALALSLPLRVGRGLSQATAVEIGTTRVLWRAFGPDLLLVLAPPRMSAGPADIRVTAASGTSAVSPGDVFTYTSG